MDKRKLGSNGFEVAPLALGRNVFGWMVDEATSFKLLDAFVGAGLNLIDTADSYSRWASGHQDGESKTIIGRWIARRGRHDNVVIATKVGSDMGQGHKVLRKDYILHAAFNPERHVDPKRGRPSAPGYAASSPARAHAHRRTPSLRCPSRAARLRPRCAIAEQSLLSD